MNSSDDSIERGRQAADQNWKDEKVLHLVYGDIYTNVPVRDELGFSLACCWESPAYIRSYNSRIRELIELHGLLRWAPASRMLTKEEIMECARTARPWTEFNLTPHPHARALKRHSQVWQTQFTVPPDRYVELPDREIFLLIGPAGEKIVIDEIDLHTDSWLKRIEFKPTEIPN